MEPKVGEIWRWMRNSHEHPDDPDYNFFLVLDKSWGTRVLYLINGKMTVYTNDTFTINKDYLEKVA